MTSDADRSCASGLAVCRCAGGVRICRGFHRRSAVVQSSRNGRRAFGPTVRGPVRVLDLLSASRAVPAEDDHDAEFVREYSGAGSASRSSSTTKTIQSSQGYYAAEQSRHRCYTAGKHPASSPGHSACGSTRGPCALGLHATVRMMFSHNVGSLAGEEGRTAA
jgi:hypothetical protein